MRIVVCYKCVPNDQEITVKSDRRLDTENAGLTISRYDLDALEAAMQLAGDGDEVFVLTYAGKAAENSKLRKAILSRGPSQMFAVHDEAAEAADSYRTASVLSAAISRIGNVDAVFCGEGSEDMYCRQVGPVLGALLGWNTVNAVSAVEKQGDVLRITRDLESCTEELDTVLPAVICGTSGMSRPRIPKMREILAAGKKPFTVWEKEDLGNLPENSSETCSVLAPETTKRRAYVLKGASDENIGEFYQLLRKSM